MNKSLKIFLVFFTVIILFSLGNSYYHGKKEFSAEYRFVIDSIKVNPTRSLVFYDDDEEINLRGFIVPENSGARAGDMLYKPACSKLLWVLRKDAGGVYNDTIAKVQYSAVFSFSCKE